MNIPHQALNHASTEEPATEISKKEGCVETITPPITEAAPTSEQKDGFWTNPAVITENNFKFKSLSSWALNIAVGCNHGCRFCYVPDTSTRKQAPKLLSMGVKDPDADWGTYVFLRPWDGKKFDVSVRRAESTPLENLKREGNRAVMLCTTTDPYQVLVGCGAAETRLLNRSRSQLVHASLRRIRDDSTLNVRILTRGPLAKQDFDLFKSFGNRMVFGMSLPTLDNDLAKIYEPSAPAPSQRLKTLRAAAEAGLHVFVAIAPTYPECDENDIRQTIRAVKDLGAITIFHEPINIRAENVARIEAHATSRGRKLNTSVFRTGEDWRRYALSQLVLVQKIAEEEGVADHLHLWPDKALLSENGYSLMREQEQRNSIGRAPDKQELAALRAQVAEDYEEVCAWVHRWHERVSEWPGKADQPWERPTIPNSLLAKQ